MRTLPLGTETQWGLVSAVGWTAGERYYWMIDEHGSVAMLPADVVEPGDGTVSHQEAMRLLRAAHRLDKP